MASINETLERDLEQSPSTIPKNSPTVYGMGAMGIALLAQAFSGYYMFYYVDVLGLAVTLAAVVNIVYAIWDAVNDPLVGYLSDNTRSRWGRRRPWLLLGLPFFITFMVLIFVVPEPFRMGNNLFWYALIMVFLFETASTVMNTNYQSLFPELFQRFRDRTRASAYTHGFGMLGELLGFSLTPILYTQLGFDGMAILLSFVAGGFLLFSITKITEDPAAQILPPIKVKEAFRDVLRDRPFWLFTIVATCLWFTTGVYTLAVPFWTKYTLSASPQAPALIFSTVFITAILVVSLWSKLVQKLGAKATWLWAIGALLTSSIVLGSASSLVIGVLGGVITGVGLGGIKVCREMILANLVDQSLKRTGHRREGIYYSLTRFIGNLSKILETLALIVLGLLFGYVSGNDPGPNPAAAFRFLIGVFPFVFLLFAWVLALRLPIGAKHEFQNDRGV
jgi:GPH family glycoside/pentoside/hexuronide:cation symporter